MWDTVGRDQAIELVKNHISSGNDRETAAKLLVDAAKSSGSSDNISVVVVYLDVNTRSGHVSLSNKEEVTSSHLSNSSHKPSTNESHTSPPNGDISYTSKPTCNSIVENNKENCHVDGSRVHIVEKKESHKSIVAKVKVPCESSKTSKAKSVTCKVTSEKHDNHSGNGASEKPVSEKTSKSADNSPKITKKSKPIKSQKLSQHSKGVKSKTSSQLGVSSEANSRRKSAPAEFSPSPSAKS